MLHKCMGCLFMNFCLGAQDLNLSGLSLPRPVAHAQQTECGVLSQRFIPEINKENEKLNAKMVPI